jgi:predicted DNA-binding protein YlxM (UPF0122 family)
MKVEELIRNYNLASLKEEIFEMYVIKNLSLKEIGKKYGLKEWQMYELIRRLNITRYRKTKK